MDEVVLEHTGRIELRDEPVLQVFDQDPRLGQQALVQAEVAWLDDVEESALEDLHSEVGKYDS